jgi:hypothetical protein
MNMLEIKKTIYKESSNTRKLETLRELSKLVDQVKQFKAFGKFMDLVEDKIPDAKPFHAQTRSKGVWRCYTNKPRYSFEKYACVFTFGPLGERYHDENGATIELQLEEKTIPSLIAAIEKEVIRRIDWKRTELEETNIYEGKIVREIEETLERGMTEAQFQKKKTQYIELLRKLATQLEGIN